MRRLPRLGTTSCCDEAATFPLHDRQTLTAPPEGSRTPPPGASALTRASHSLQQWLLLRASRSLWACGLAGFSLAASLTVAQGFPPPARIHDEFSYLLAGDTFAHGRLTNPTHPMWMHLESFHIVQVPTYSSKYPPAQGLALALGQRLTGAPIVGVWISCALMVAAFNWMLLAWVGARWALWGALGAAFWITGLHSVEGYWAASYWGGAVAAMGAALVLGGVRRLLTLPTASGSVATGVGLAVLANSRPFEGLLFAIVPAIVVASLVVRLVRKGAWRPATTAVVPMTLVLVACVILMGWHNRAVTGSATLPPYLAYDQQYASSPSLVGQDAPPMPAYRIAVMKQFYTAGTGATKAPQGWREHASLTRRNLAVFIAWFVPFFIAPLIVALPWAVRGRWMFLPFACVSTTLVTLALTLYWSQPHYIAPAAAAWCVLLTHAARLIAKLRTRTSMVGILALRIVGACLVLSALGQGVFAYRLRDSREPVWAWRRQAMERSLARNGTHLVIVEYGPRHAPDFEWVYNRADIDASPVVWARSLGEPRDAALREYYDGRTQWHLYVDSDKGPFTLTPIARDRNNAHPDTRVTRP